TAGHINNFQGYLLPPPGHDKLEFTGTDVAFPIHTISASLQTLNLGTSDETLYEDYDSPSVNYVNG
ncbi:hypothetical protein NDU88_009350, partial [Pleurodeles waltl]